jgi:hypothetical protein
MQGEADAPFLQAVEGDEDDDDEDEDGDSEEDSDDDDDDEPDEAAAAEEEVRSTRTCSSTCPCGCVGPCAHCTRPQSRWAGKWLTFLHRPRSCLAACSTADRGAGHSAALHLHNAGRMMQLGTALHARWSGSRPGSCTRTEHMLSSRSSSDWHSGHTPHIQTSLTKPRRWTL